MNEYTKDRWNGYICMALRAEKTRYLAVAELGSEEAYRPALKHYIEHLERGNWGCGCETCLIIIRAQKAAWDDTPEIKWPACQGDGALDSHDCATCNNKGWQ